MVKVFISYSHQDEHWKDRLVKQLAVLAGAGLAVWDDRRIGAGAAWEAEIAAALNDCDLALLLISADFLTSGFILGQEVPALLQRRQGEGIRLIPVILSPCPWQRIPWLASIQARPKDGKPLSGLSRHGADAALAALAGEVADLVLPPAATPFGPTANAASGPTSASPSGPTPSPAAAIWRERLEFLLVEEAKAASAAERFALKKQIEEAQAKLKELS